MAGQLQLTSLVPQMIEIYRVTRSTREVARRLGICKYSVLKYLHAAGVATVNPHSHKDTVISANAAAWLAGFIDAEGHFGIAKFKSDGVVNYRPRLTIVNTNKYSIDKVKALAGGGAITCRRKSTENPNWSDCYAITLMGKSMQHTIIATRPYHIVKLKHAALYIEYLSATKSDKSISTKLDFKNRFEELSRDEFKSKAAGTYIESAQPTPNKHDAAWLAGFLDGEARIGLRRLKRQGRREQYLPILVVANANRNSIERARQLAGGGYLRLAKAKSPNKSDIYWLTISHTNLRRVIDMIKPHCIIKAKHVDLYLEYMTISRSDRSLQTQLSFKNRFEMLARNGFKARLIKTV